MVGSPFHVETAIYKYYAEKSDVPVAQSEFNKSITRCDHCIYYCDIGNGKELCVNLSGNANNKFKHCKEYGSSKEIMNPVEFRKTIVNRYLSDKTRKIFLWLSIKLKNFHQDDNPIFSKYLNKKWIVLGSSKICDKQTIYKVIEALNGDDWHGNKTWDYKNSDIVITLSNGTWKEKIIKDSGNNNKIIGIQQFIRDCLLMIVHLKTKR